MTDQELLAYERESTREMPMRSVRPVGGNSYPPRALISSLCIRALQ